MFKPRKNWTTHRLGDLCDICRGSSPRPIADQRFFVNGTIPWIKIADATKSGKYLYHTKEHVNEFGASYSRCLPAGSLIIAASGTLGYPQMLGVKGCAHDGWLIPSNFRGIDSQFLYYYFLWKKEFFYSSAYGAAIQNINTMILKEMEVTIPSLLTQRKIASILSAYDDLIENNTRRIAILENMAQAIYRECFVNFRFPGHEVVKLVQQEQDLPAGWQRKPLCEIADLRLGKMLDAKKNKGDLMPYLANINVRWGKFDLQNLREMKFQADELETYGLRYGDIVMCEGGEPGRCAIWTDQIPDMKVQKAIHRIRSRSDVQFRYLYYSLLHKAQAGHLESLFTGATIKHLPREKLQTVLIEVPTENLMKLFSNMVEPMGQRVELLNKRNENLRTTRDLLLPKLISGQLDVEDLDIDLGARAEELQESTA
jgi:type I restriction enzyme S subunit